MADKAFKWTMGPAANKGEMLTRLPGVSPIATGALGGLAGLAYHLGKRKLYNTDEENQEEDTQGVMPLLKRVGIPALGGAAVGALERGFTPSYYEDIANGNNGNQFMLFPKR